VNAFRKSSQRLLPPSYTPSEGYDLYPARPIANDTIETGYAALARQLARYRTIIADGYVGVLWEHFRVNLDETFAASGKAVQWLDVRSALKPEADIDALVAPFLGGNDPLFGTRFTGELRDFFNADALANLQPDAGADINILYGTGAALAGWDGALVYLDVPKNEIQYRSRAGSIANLGANAPADPKAMYKRFYFVDWVACNRHKADLLPRIGWMVDEQNPDAPAFMPGDALRAALADMRKDAFRARPWFEPGPWGGQWLKQYIPQLPQDVPNYAWSFEMIAPEQGLLFRSGDRLLEVSFDTLMFYDHQAVLGDFAARFGYEFPIRFDFLDTFEGGNLSVQCHPRLTYIRERFGETITQDETYYILDCEPGAQVYLGFCKDIRPDEFREALETSFTQKTPLDVGRFVNIEPAHIGDLFLIPNGTIHCSGANNLVLEISATPYIFTFKMYDWLRLDLEGNPRPLNIERAFANLDFSRKGARVRETLVSRPATLDEGEGWRRVHLPTHPEHFYDVYRLEFTGEMAMRTNGSPHLLMLVAGEQVAVQTARGGEQVYHFAETFIVPAAADRYHLRNLGSSEARVIVAFLKPEQAP
jgi:mannose-6-phosphate isomerase class I